MIDMGRVDVSVEYRTDADGNIFPLRVLWHDGRKWEIERLLHICRSPDSSFEGVRYTVRIDGAAKYLYQTDTGWYVIPNT